MSDIILSKSDFILFGCRKSMYWTTYTKCKYDNNLFITKIANEDKAVFKYILSKKNGRNKV